MTKTELATMLQSKRSELDALMKSFTDDSGEIKADVAEVDVKKAEDLTSEISKLQSQLDTAIKLEKTQAENKSALETLSKPEQKLPSASKTNDDIEVKAISRGQWKGIYESEKDAFKAGRFYQAVLGGNEGAKRYCEENGVDFKALTSGVEGSAGLFVLPQIETAIIRLVAQYGVARSQMKVVTTNSATHQFFKWVSGNTAYFVGEQGTPTSTDAAWQTINLTPKTIAALTKYSLQLDADSAINLASQITQELAFAHSILEDQSCFIGDGTSTYGGIVGALYKFRQIFEAAGGTWGTNMAYLGGAQIASGNAYSEVVLNDFVQTTSKVAQYPGINPKWYINKITADQTMWRLWYGLSGNQSADLVNGVPTKFLGYPVVYVNAMPSTEANDQVMALFGDLTMSSVFCDRQGIQISTNTQGDTNWLTRSAQVMSVARFDCVTHDVGNYHATAASRTQGALAALITAHS
jgi:HK97 family phage major capsid protein